MTGFEVAAEIALPRDEVYACVSDLRRLPEWNSAVQRVTPVNDDASGRRYLMERRLPSGAAVNELEVVARRPPDELAIRTTSGPTPFLYRHEFATTARGTLVTLHGDVGLGGAAALLGPVAALDVRRGVEADLGMLRDVLERG